MMARKSKGFTLVEAMISAAILSMITVTFLAMLVQGIKGFNTGSARQSAVSDVTLALQKLSREVRDGKSAHVSDGGSLVVTFPTTLTDPDTQERVYDLSSDDPVTPSYYVSGGNLVRNRSGVVTVMARGISTAAFGASGGLVTITLTSVDGSGKYSCQMTGRIALRNYRSQ